MTEADATLLTEIKARHAETVDDLMNSDYMVLWIPHGQKAHRDRARLLRLIERLDGEIKYLKSVSTDPRRSVGHDRVLRSKVGI